MRSFNCSSSRDWSMPIRPRTWPRRPTTRGSRSGAGQDNLVIAADPDSRMIMVRADEKTFTKIRDLVAKLDAAGPEGRAVQTLIALQHAQASSVATALTQAFSPRRRTGRGTQISPDEQVTVVAESMSNSIIVTANEKNLE